MVKVYQHKPLKVQAIQWTSKNLQRILEFTEAEKHNIVKYAHPDWMLRLWITRRDPIIDVDLRDYIVITEQGDILVMNPRLFGQFYEEINE